MSTGHRSSFPLK